MKRLSGILMPMSSLPSPYGIGTMGKSAYEFADFVKASGQAYWQVLPLGPTGYGDSPYQSFSTFAGNPYYIDLDMLVEDGLLTKEDLEGINWGEDETHTDYGRIYESRYTVLRKAFANGRVKLENKIAHFLNENRHWLENYAIYMAVKAHFDMKPWTEWPDEEIRLHRPSGLQRYRSELREDVEFYIFMQYLFFDQWTKLRAYAHKIGVRFIGDVPIYVSLDSADVWSEPQFFQLDEENLPVEVAGVPPDQFTADGQLWGNPLYDWDAMERDGYGWWIRRIEGAGKLFDMIRIDHFRGFESYWSVPADETTAKNGKWRKGPGLKLVGMLGQWFNTLSFIAEDLGYVVPEVKQLREDSHWPGMSVLEFAFDPEGDNDYLPHNIRQDSICYMGTHDNDTALGWVDSLDEETLDFAKNYMHITEEEGWCWGMIRTGMATAAQLFVVQMQDLLELDGSARMNTPGKAAGNWQWRMKPGAATPELAKRLYDTTVLYRRTELPKKVKEEEPEETNEKKETVQEA